jgi:hypothetical protein
MRMLMLSFAALSLSSCTHTAAQVDSFCQVYNQVITQKGDGTIAASSGVKRRLLANELTYKQLCQQHQ